MKFLIENYCDNNHTQPLYFHNELNKQGHNAILYETNSKSIFDILDSNKPDYYITHASLLKRDHIEYSKQGKVKFLLNVQNLSQDEIKNLDIFLNNSNIECPFFFLNTNILPNVNHRNIVRILDCADTNLIKQKSIVDYKIDKAFIIQKKHEIKENGPYHIISNNVKIKDEIDICLPEIHLCCLYEKYDHLIFMDIETSIPQSFFDAIMMGKSISYKSKNEEAHRMIDSVFKNCSIDNEKIISCENLKNFILDKHTPRNRVKTLLSQLPKE